MTSIDNDRFALTAEQYLSKFISLVCSFVYVRVLGNFSVFWISISYFAFRRKIYAFVLTETKPYFSVLF